MRSRVFLTIASSFLLLVSSAVASSDSEEEILQRYMNKIQKKRTSRMTWMSAHFSVNRIDRDNDYNAFANYETLNFTDATIPWLGEATTLGADFGMVFSNSFAWTLGFEYWFELGESLEGTYYYEPSGTYVENPESKINVFGITTGIQYYLKNRPSRTGELEKMAVRVGAGCGFYKVKWEVWEDYWDFNLVTNYTDASSAAFEDQTLGFNVNMGIDYPTRAFGLILGVDLGYLALKFDNVSWVNTWDQEVVASYTGDADGRVDLDLSGFTAKVELKRFFCW